MFGVTQERERAGLLYAIAAAAVFVAAGCRERQGSAEVVPSESWFVDVTGQWGVDFVYTNGADGNLYLPEIMGFGAAIFDLDNDGLLDLYFVNGNESLPDYGHADGPPNRLYRQLPDGRFEDVTETSGLGDTGYGMGVAVGDFDNDGFDDVYVANLGLDQLFRNRGDGTFENVTRSANIHVDGWSASACFFDFDRDGFLDLYVVRYVLWRPKECFAFTGRRDYCGPKAFLPAADVLLRNNGNGTFSDLTESAGVAARSYAGLGVVCEDLDLDGWMDVYVANDADPNLLWINRHDGTFHDLAVELGAAYNIAGAVEAGMGVVAADFDNDGFPDLFCTHLIQESNTLYRSLGVHPAAVRVRSDGTGRTGGADARRPVHQGFADATSEANLSWSSLPCTGFGTVAFDAELDGDLDLIVVNGAVKRRDPLPRVALPPPWDVLAEPNFFYLNDGAGRFELDTQYAAAVTDPVEISRGLAVGDLDNDGRLDLVVTNIQTRSRIYRNDAPRRGAYLSVKATDPRLRRDAIGARIIVTAGGRRLTRTVTRAMSYMSSTDSRAHFGLGRVSSIERIEVHWPDGLREVFAARPVNTAVELIRGTGTAP